MDLATDAEVTAAWPGFAKLPADERAALISDASAAIEDYCRRSFDAGTATEVRSGNNQPRLWLRNTPVVSVASVTVNGAEYTNADGSDWTVVAATGELVRGSGLADPRFGPWFPRGTSNITVVYDHGYASVPGPVRRACILAVRSLAELAKASGVYDSESLGDYSYTRGSASQAAIPDAAKALLSRYVRGDLL